MDWDLCKTFVAVAETHSFAAAARQLRSSHPTVGRKIAALEDQLGTKLFARSNEGLSLTAQGRKFREHVEAMASAALRAEAAVSATGAHARGVVKLSIGATLAAHWLMPRMGTFLREHGHLQLEIITHPFPASVRRREADVVLRPVDSGEENLIGRKIGRLGTGFYASRDYAARQPVAGAARRMEGPQRDRLCRPRVERASGALERSDHAAGHRRDALFVAGRHARGHKGRARDFSAVLPGRRGLSRPRPRRAAKTRQRLDLWLLAHPDLVELPAVRAVIGFVTSSRARIGSGCGDETDSAECG